MKPFPLPAKRSSPRRIAFVLALEVFAVVASASGDQTPAQSAMVAAQALVDAGDFDGSLPKWKEALDISTRAGDVKVEIEASIRLASAYESLGQSHLAEVTLNSAQALSQKSGDKISEAIIDSSLGAIYTLSSDTDDGDALLAKGLKLARQSKDKHATAVALNNSANLAAYQGRYDEAASGYKEASELADETHDPLLALKAASNLTDSLVAASHDDAAEKWAAIVDDKCASLPDGHEKAYALIGEGKAQQDIFVRNGSREDKLRLKAFDAYRRAAEIATRINDQRALSYALGYEAELYEMEKKFTDSLGLARRAVFLAQSARAPDILFRWQALSGRLLVEQGDNEAALAADEAAIVTLHSIRHDLSLRYGNSNYHSSFREIAGPVFFGLADLLLQRADTDKDDKARQADLVQARDTMEDLKSAELEDYFQDDCANLLKSKTKPVTDLSNSAVVIYFIPLLNRTEILVTLPSGRIERVKSPVTADQLEDTATAFRYQLEKRTTDEYLDQSRQLYDWLIRPLDAILEKSRANTLVFVPDGALLTIPMSALNDGQQFLIQKYAVATIPGMTLLESSPLNQHSGTLISNGLSDSVGGYAPLQHVPEEMHEIEALYGGPQYMNRQFVKSEVDQEFATDDYSIVHIASHGHFDSDAGKTWVLAYDGKVTLNDLERMIRPSQIRDKPVELLTLSACQTAAGDDRAALGLAGIAVKSGARSAFATLWFVDDEASTVLIGKFYSDLHNTPGITKARALQNAQVKLLADPRYNHPCYWAPYLIIGNWL